MPRTVAARTQAGQLRSDLKIATAPATEQQLTKGDDRDDHGHSRAGSIFPDTTAGEVQMHVNLVEWVLLLGLGNPELKGVRFHPRKREMGRFGNDVPELAGEMKRAVTREGGGLDVCTRLLESAG